MAPVYFLPTQAAFLCSQWTTTVGGGQEREKELCMLISEWERDIKSTHQMCAPVGGACLYVCAVWGLSSCQSGTCGGPPHLKQCHPKIQLEFNKNICYSHIVTTTITIIPRYGRSLIIIRLLPKKKPYKTLFKQDVTISRPFYYSIRCQGQYVV